MKLSSDSNEENLQKAERIAYLIAGHIRGTLTPKEADELDEWLVESDENIALFENLTDEDNLEAAMQQYRQADKEKAGVLAGIKRKLGVTTGYALGLWPYLMAASVIIVVSGLLLFHAGNKSGKPTEKPMAHIGGRDDIKSGTEKAVLTLSDGRTIILDTIVSGLLANEGSVNIQKSAKGEIKYDGSDNNMKYNTVSTPRGGQYKLVLGDGTRVWLNNESALKFPAGFASNQREVELTGEAYFEVAKDPARPFMVKVKGTYGNGGTVEVLGTHFNINGYGDEEDLVKTTLVEGSLRVERNGKARIIKPGEQALSAADITVVQKNVAEDIAWKEGKFLFRDEKIHSIGEQIKRWYDIKVVYQGNITQHFNLEISRSIPLSALLNALEGTRQVHFTWADNKLVIKP